MSVMGHFRPIQRGRAMSGYPPEAHIVTAGIDEDRPKARTSRAKAMHKTRARRAHPRSEHS